MDVGTESSLWAIPNSWKPDIPIPTIGPMAKKKLPSQPPLPKISQAIFLVRGQRVMLDEDLARIYGVTTKRLNEQVRRNEERFPEDFMFSLTTKELNNLRSQIATSSWGGRRHPPRAFTEHGAVMLASVLKSPVAVEASIQVVRAFVSLREMMAQNEELAAKLEKLEAKFDQQFAVVFEAIRQLMRPDPRPTPRIGFK